MFSWVNTYLYSANNSWITSFQFWVHLQGNLLFFLVLSQVAFEDVLAEPDGVHSFDIVWKCSYNFFNFGKNCCYMLMTTMCGMFIALYWGCEFALISFYQVWCISPLLSIFSIYMGCAQKMYGTYVRCYLEPICETCGLLFSRISVKSQSWFMK